MAYSTKGVAFWTLREGKKKQSGLVCVCVCVCVCGKSKVKIHHHFLIKKQPFSIEQDASLPISNNQIKLNI